MSDPENPGFLDLLGKIFRLTAADLLGIPVGVSKRLLWYIILSGYLVYGLIGRIGLR